MKKTLIVSFAVMGLMAGESPVQADTFNNASVVALAKAGIGDDVVLSKIASLPCSYDISTDQIIALKSAGVSNPVIAAMVGRCTGSSKAQGASNDSADPSVKRTSGLYIELGAPGQHNIKVIRPTTASGARVSGNGSILFPFTARLDIPRATAQMHAANGTPTFYFYFETDDRKVGDFGTSASASAQSPSEFNLVQFKLKNGQREMVIGKITPFGTKVGLNPKDAIQFSINDLGDGVFSVQPNAPLPSGEYGFVLRAGSDSYRIYDFDVTS